MHSVWFWMTSIASNENNISTTFEWCIPYFSTKSSSFYRAIIYEMVYFAQDMTTNEYIMPYTFTVETRSQLTTEINTKISTLTITGTLVSIPCSCCISCFYSLCFINNWSLWRREIILFLFANQGQSYATVNVSLSTSAVYRLELGALFCANGYIPMHMEEMLLTGVQGGYDQHDPGKISIVYEK